MRTQRTKNSREFRAPRLPNDLTELLVEKIFSLTTSVRTDYLKSEILSKFVSDDTAPPEARIATGLRKWLAAERDNEATTDRLLTTPAEYNILPRVTYQRFMEFCCALVIQLIGEVPSVDSLIGSFSGGATTSRPRTQGQPSLKYHGKAHITEAALAPFLTIVEEMPAWLSAQRSLNLRLEDRLGNAMFTVPKNTEEDRVAAKEPDLNMFIQKGTGLHFRRSLLRAGINLNDQSINRSLALRGSIDGSLATLDLSRASDSVTTELVFQMLPVTWYTLLDSVRSHVTILPDGEEHRNVMFSSMGNGFTFELESLLFYVLMRATAYFTGTTGIISVYGDDLIIPTEMAEYAIWVLGYFGFQVNTEKSHTSGPFRESCGGHYWNGVDITPFYVRAPIKTITDLIHVANQLREWGTLRVNGEMISPIIDPEIEEIWLWLKSLVPSILWGGGDTSFKYQLVSSDIPRMRLHEETKSVKTGLGGYLHWLNTTWDRKGEIEEAVCTSRYSIPLGKLRLKPVRNKTVPRLEALFRHEVGLILSLIHI